MVQPATVSAVAGCVLQRLTCVGRADEWHLEKEPSIAYVNLGDQAENLGSLAAFNEGKLEISGDNPGYPI
jgi:hypothetical protein